MRRRRRFVRPESRDEASVGWTFVEAVQAQPIERWVPWLIDLLRFDPSTRISADIRSTLAEITGIPSESRIPDLINYGSWAFSRDLDGGDHYRAFKVSLYERIDRIPLQGSAMSRAVTRSLSEGS